MEDYRRRVILDKLSQNRGDVRRTAADLKISVRSIYRYVNHKEGGCEKGVSRRR
jgi:transcriptional regulator with PAS, ATPase and Fis domain